MGSKSGIAKDSDKHRRYSAIRAGSIAVSGNSLILGGAANGLFMPKFEGSPNRLPIGNKNETIEGLT